MVHLSPVSPVVSRTLFLAEVWGFSILPPARPGSLAHALVDHFGLHINQYRSGLRAWNTKGQTTMLTYLITSFQGSPTSECGGTEEAVPAARAVRFPPSLLNIVGPDGVEQLLTHLVPALTQLNRHHWHLGPIQRFVPSILCNPLLVFFLIFSLYVITSPLWKLRAKLKAELPVSKLSK